MLPNSVANSIYDQHILTTCQPGTTQMATSLLKGGEPVGSDGDLTLTSLEEGGPTGSDGGPLVVCDAERPEDVSLHPWS